MADIFECAAGRHRLDGTPAGDIVKKKKPFEKEKRGGGERVKTYMQYPNESHTRPPEEALIIGAVMAPTHAEEDGARLGPWCGNCE